MGITGSGKSTFISKLVDAEIVIGHQLQSYNSLTLNRQNEKMKRDADNVYCQVPATFGRMISFIILDNAYFF